MKNHKIIKKIFFLNGYLPTLVISNFCQCHVMDAYVTMQEKT